jgi:hypothetical protein
MLTDDTEITPGRIRLIQVVASILVLDGVISLVLVFLRLATFGFHWLMPLGWIGDIIIGFGLLRFNRGAYIAARWWICLKLVAYVAWLVWMVVLGVRISQLHGRGSSILASFERAMTPSLLLFVGFIVLAVWQLWVLNRRYTRSVFGCDIVSAKPIWLVQRRLP